MVAFILSLAILALFILALLTMGLVGADRKTQAQHLVALDLPPEQQEQRSKPAPRKVEVTHAAAAAPPRPSPLQKADNTPPPPPPVPGPPGFIHMSHDEMAAADIGKMSRGGPTGGDTGSGGAGDGIGKGPDGSVMYRGEWYRKPTQAELTPYMKSNAPAGSWAYMACRTAEHYHVVDCQALDESPRGSGLARGYVNASWQFLFRPPKIDGKPQIGVWVAFRLDVVPPGQEDR